MSRTPLGSKVLSSAQEQSAAPAGESKIPATVDPLEATNRVALVLVVMVGLAYFSRYYSHGFNVGDEGSLVLIAKRLMELERPYLDVEIGYGLLWYYPIVLLFKLTGPSFIVARVYFLSLALATGVLAFLTVRRRTRNPTLAGLVALAVLAVPGTLHKAYIPLIVVANMLVLPSFDRGRGSFDPRKVFTAGLVAACSYYVRPDIGLCAAVVLVTVLVALSITHSASWSQRIQELRKLAVLLSGAALVPTVPLALVAFAQGFLGSFFLNSLAWPLKVVRSGFLRILFSANPRPDLTDDLPPEAGTLLARAPLGSLFEGGQQGSLAILTYLPILTLAIIILVSCWVMVRHRRSSRPALAEDTLGILALLLLSFSTFTQFYLFRPDLAHLSQFMPGYVVLAGVCLGQWVLPTPKRQPHGAGAEGANRLVGKLGRALLGGFLGLHIIFYVWFGLRQPATGSIAIRGNRTEKFVGANGVNVFVSPAEKKLFKTVVRVIEDNTSADDTVLCYPYCPGFNVIANRKTTMRKLYVDDSMLIKRPGWQKKTIDYIKSEKPPLIIINDNAPNATEISRFRNWAVQVMRHIESEYVVSETFGSLSFYVRMSRPDETVEGVGALDSRN